MTLFSCPDLKNERLWECKLGGVSRVTSYSVECGLELKNFSRHGILVT